MMFSFIWKLSLLQLAEYLTFGLLTLLNSNSCWTSYWTWSMCLWGRGGWCGRGKWFISIRQQQWRVSFRHCSKIWIIYGFKWLDFLLKYQHNLELLYFSVFWLKMILGARDAHALLLRRSYLVFLILLSSRKYLFYFYLLYGNYHWSLCWFFFLLFFLTGDQGFLNSYYSDFPNAHVFQPNLPQEVLNSRPVPDMERLSTLYNADVGLYMLANKVLDS